MPFLIPVALGIAAVAVGVTTTLGMVLSVVSIISSVVVSGRESRRARLQAEESARIAYNESLRDRTLMVRGEVKPASLIVGECMVGSIMTFATSWGPKKENFRMTACLSRHPIHSIVAVLFGDDYIAIENDGYVQTAPYLRARTDNVGGLQDVVPGNPHQITLPQTPHADSVWIQDQTVQSYDQGGILITLINGTDYTLSGNVVTFAAGHAGKFVNITYTYSTSQSWCNIRKYLGNQTTADGGFVSEMPSEWSAAHVGYGIAYLAFSAAYDEDIWAQGLRDVRAIVWGAKVYDPRKDSTVAGGSGSHRTTDESTWEWTNNSALITAWYLTHKYGVRVPWAKVSMSALILAANICDEEVPLYGNGVAVVTNGSNLVEVTGGTFNNGMRGQTFIGPDGNRYKIDSYISPTIIGVVPQYAGATTTAPYLIVQKRYTCDGTISTAAGKRANLDMITQTMYGAANYVQGIWFIRAGAYVTPTITLNESFLGAGDIEIVPDASYQEIANRATGTFANALDMYREGQIPEWSSSVYTAEDNGEPLPLTINLPLTTDAVRARRLLKIAVVDSREAMTIKVNCNMRAYKITVGDIINVSLAFFGISNKPFRVKRRRYTPKGSIELLLREEPAGKYDWSFGETTAMPTALNSTFVNPFEIPLRPFILSVLSGSTELLRQKDGTYVARIKVNWMATSSDFVARGGRVELQFQGGANRTPDAWYDGGVLAGDSTYGYCSPVVEGTEYLIRVRFVSAMGVASEWSFVRHIAIGKLSPPPNLTNLLVSVLASGTRKFSAALGAEIPDAAGIEIRHLLATSATWESMTRLVYIPYINGKLLYDWESELPVAGTYTFAAKVIDLQGHESVSAVFINNATLSNSPVTYGVRLNMLMDADWTADLGYPVSTYYGDARALYGWDSGQSGGWFCGRNYGGGAAWNHGNGGCWVYRPGPTFSGQYFQMTKRVIPILGSQMYEIHVRVNPHRASCALYVAFFNSLDNFIEYATGSPDTYDSGAGLAVTDAGAHPSKWPLLWIYAQAPADAAYMRISLETRGTGNADSYCFFQQLFLAAGAVPGITKATATPWIDGSPSFLHGGQISDATVTTVAELKSADGSYTSLGFNDGTSFGTSLQWTNDTPKPVQCGFHASGVFKYYWPGSGAAPEYAYIEPVLRIGSTYYMGGAAHPEFRYEMIGTVPNNFWTPWSQNYVLVVQPGETVYFYGFIAAGRYNSPPHDGIYLYWKALTWQIQAIKK